MLAGLKAFGAEAAEAAIDWPVTGRIAACTAAILLLWYRGMCAYFIHVRKDPLPLSEKRKAWCVIGHDIYRDIDIPTRRASLWAKGKERGSRREL
jgi:hypothetical protein